MAARIVKKISDPYDILAINGGPTRVTIGAASTGNAVFTVNGNLVVTGNSTLIDSATLNVGNAWITLNADLSSNATPTTDAGIIVNRGIQANAALIWNETLQHWQITNDGTNFANIATQFAAGQFITSVVEDTSPQLGGNLDVNGQTITSFNNVVIAPTVYTQIDSAIQLMQIPSTPPANVPGFGLLYAGVPGNGESGLYVTNTLVSNQEIITERKAIIYALLF